MRYLLIALLLLSGCAANTIKPDIIKVCKHQWDKQTGQCWICGASYSPIQKEQKKIKYKLSAKDIITQAIMTESGLSEPDAVILWDKYKRSSIKGFARYLIQVNPYYKQNWVYIDFVERVKVRTKILKRERR